MEQVFSGPGPKNLERPQVGTITVHCTERSKVYSLVHITLSRLESQGRDDGWTTHWYPLSVRRDPERPFTPALLTEFLIYSTTHRSVPSGIREG